MDPLIIFLAFGLGYLANRIGLPPLVGYLAAGFALSAQGYTSGPVMREVADVGVTVLLFSIGLKLKLKTLFKPEVWAGASLHMLITVSVFTLGLAGLAAAGLGLFADLTPTTALLLAFTLSFSSTVFAVKILEESGRAGSLNGRTAIGVLIVQDIAAVLFLAFSTGKVPSVWALAMLAGLPLARLIFLRMLDRIGHGELQVLFGFFLAMVAGAYGFDLVGLKADLGALIMGMLLAGHDQARDLADSLLNIKDVLLVGFFLNIGLSGLPSLDILWAALLLVAVLPLKAGLFLLLFTRFRLRARTAFITALNLANYSEFGLIVGGLAVASGWLPREWLLVLAVALSLSFILAAPFNRQGDALFDRTGDALKRLETVERHPDEEPFEAGRWRIVIMGMGRIGTGAYDYFTNKFGPVALGLDFNAETVDRHLEAGRQAALADVTNPDFWRKLPERDSEVKLIVLAVPSLEAQLYVAEKTQEMGFTGKLAAVAQYDDEIEILREAGVDTSLNVFSEAGAGLGAHICNNLSVPELGCEIVNKDTV
ncbi:4'-phosphopantetheinyl transferase [Pseudodesulfovibrio cashew]|uniref:4'-phosphopantetheinyl transferase n=1 Tax=Pseudodesulfovibrio cashew TaxID=2678688 RepID=A0A6I6JHX1_9BACT|nr:cation:proton antiporter [Pseudodesulfovibrio cashew]QGY40073.1 4'-phosphopantetheinyl transferase [Pseudodesulfovibrio cashew]